MTRGFTLLEVVVALVVLEVAVVGAVGALALASVTLGRAERLERATALAEGVLDSLQRVPGPDTGARPFAGGQAGWSVDDSGRVVLHALDTQGDTLLSLRGLLRP